MKNELEFLLSQENVRLESQKDHEWSELYLRVRKPQNHLPLSAISLWARVSLTTITFRSCVLSIIMRRQFPCLVSQTIVWHESINTQPECHTACVAVNLLQIWCCCPRTVPDSSCNSSPTGQGKNREGQLCVSHLWTDHMVQRMTVMHYSTVYRDSWFIAYDTDNK